jgi:hypothetical protein
VLGAFVLVVRDLLDDEILKAQPPIALQPLRCRRTVWASVVSREARTSPCNRQPISLPHSTSASSHWAACVVSEEGERWGVSESDCDVCCSRAPSSSRPRPSPAKSSFISLMKVHLHPS